MEVMISDLKQQEVSLMKQIDDKAKDFVSKEDLKQLQEKMAEMNGSNKIVIQMLDQKEDRFSQKLIKEVVALDTKIVTSEGKMDAAVTTNRQEIAAVSKDLQAKVEKSSEELKAQLQMLSSDLNQKLDQNETSFNQKLLNEVKQLDDKINKYQTTMLSHDLEKETKQLNEEINQLNKKTCEMEHNIDTIFKFIVVKDYRTKVEAIQQLNPQLNQIEIFQRGIAIEQFLNRKSSIQQLVDSFLFGSAQEQMAFESLCFKWTIKDIVTAKSESHESLSDIFSAYGHQLKGQLRFKFNYSVGNKYIMLHLCFKDEARKWQEVDIKPLPRVTFVIKDLSGHNKHLIRYKIYSSNASVAYNQFDYDSIDIDEWQWTVLISPQDASLEVLVLVEPYAIINNPLSVNGIITDTIQHYSKKLQMVKERLIDSHWSPNFLTHAGGFRVAVDMWLNRNMSDNKRGLMAWIHFLPGEFDFQLGREFKHETSVMLINHLDAKNNITIKKQAKEAVTYGIEIAESDAIDSLGFILNDSLTYHVTIKAIQKLIIKQYYRA